MYVTAKTFSDLLEYISCYKICLLNMSALPFCLSLQKPLFRCLLKRTNGYSITDDKNPTQEVPTTLSTTAIPQLPQTSPKL